MQEYREYVAWMISINDIPLSYEQWKELILYIQLGIS